MAHLVDASGIETLLYSLHCGVAAVVARPEIELTREESRSLAEALAAVAEHYDWMRDTSPVIIAWVNLLICAVIIYVPRLVALRRPRGHNGGPPIDDRPRAQQGIMPSIFDVTAPAGEAAYPA